MLIRFIGLMAIFAIFGCGMMAKEEESQKLSIPQKISMEMPKELKSSSEKNATKSLNERVKVVEKEDNQSKSLGYEELKEDVAQTEAMIADLELNLLFINQVIGEIESRCERVKPNRVCTIEEDVLSFEIDENLSKQIGTSDYLMGDILFFGEVEFTQYGEQENYQYEIKIDNSFANLINSTETIKWSKDEQQIYSWFEEETKGERREIGIDYNISTTGEKIMQIEDNYFDKFTKESDIFNLEIVKKTDEAHHYEIYSSSQTEEYIDDQKEYSFFSSEGELSSSGGYLLFYGEFSDGEIMEREVFDKNGELEETYYCISDMDCDMEDEESWYE